MPEYILEFDQNQSVVLPSDITNLLDLEPGDKLVLTIEDDHIVMGKLPMDAEEKGRELKDAVGKTYKL